MIPACLSSVYLTPSGALCGLPPVLAGAQSRTDHFILWDKPVFQSPLKPWGSGAGSSKSETSKVGTLPQVTHAAACALLQARVAFLADKRAGHKYGGR